MVVDVVWNATLTSVFIIIWLPLYEVGVFEWAVLLSDNPDNRSGSHHRFRT